MVNNRLNSAAKTLGRCISCNPSRRSAAFLSVAAGLCVQLLVVPQASGSLLHVLHMPCLSHSLTSFKLICLWSGLSNIAWTPIHQPLQTPTAKQVHAKALTSAAMHIRSISLRAHLVSIRQLADLTLQGITHSSLQGLHWGGDLAWC